MATVRRLTFAEAWRLGLHEQERKRLLHGHGPPVFHGQAIPKMILVGHGLEQVDAGLMLQGDVALQLGQNLFLQFAHVRWRSSK